MDILIIDTEREGYAPEQVRNTMTVGELIAFLQDYDEDTPIYTGHDNRYTYGGIVARKIELADWDEENK
jgi:hypothetical protein